MILSTGDSAGRLHDTRPGDVACFYVSPCIVHLSIINKLLIFYCLETVSKTSNNIEHMTRRYKGSDLIRSRFRLIFCRLSEVRNLFYYTSLQNVCSLNFNKIAKCDMKQITNDKFVILCIVSVSIDLS